MPTKTQWTEHMDNDLRSLFKEGLSSKEIAAHMYLSVPTINYRLDYLGLKPRKPRSEPAQYHSSNNPYFITDQYGNYHNNVEKRSKL